MASDLSITPRWEWRAFRDSFPMLESLVPPAPAGRSFDIYIVSELSDSNVKIRGDTIDIKRLLRVDGGLELWLPVFKARFPLSHPDAVRLFSELAFPPPPDERPLTLVELIAENINPHSRLHVVGVRKLRRHAVRDGCLIEHTAIEVDERCSETFAIESERPEDVRKLIHACSLDEGTNVNYVAFLKQRIGISPLQQSVCATGGRLP